MKLIQNFLKATEGQFQTECTENCGWGTQIWVGACIQIKSRTAAKSSSKYKTHSNIMLYTALVQLVMIWIFTAYIFLMERLYICLHFFLLCFWLFWGFLICPILGFLFTSSLDQYSEEESLNMYGKLHLKKPLCKICNGARHCLYGQSLGNQILAWIIEYPSILEWTPCIIIQIIYILMHCKLVWKLIYRTDKGHATMEKIEANGDFIHSQKE